MRCVIHIGTEKTATTLLQKWLYENETTLSRQGVALTHAGGAPNNRKLVAFVRSEIDDYLRDAGVTTQEERDAFFDRFHDQLRAEIREKATTHHTIVFTSEHFHSRIRDEEDIRRLKSILDEFVSEYRIVCYFREQAQVRTSLYSTALKVSSPVRLEEFQAGIGPNNHYYNYLSFFQKWEAVFGIGSLRPRLFEHDAIKDGDMRLDFLHAALPDTDAAGLSFETISENKSLSPVQADIFREINACKPNFVGRFADPTPQALKDAVLACASLDTGTALQDPRQEALYEVFNDVNIEFFDRYFGERRNLFKRPQPAADAPEEPRLSPADVVALVAQIASIESLVVIRHDEINFMRDLALRLYENDALSAPETIRLLKVAQRARPKGGWIKEKLEELSKKGKA